MNNEPEKKNENETEPRRHLTVAERQAIYAEHAKEHKHTAARSAKEKKLRVILAVSVAALVLVVGLVAFLIVNATVLEPKRGYETAEREFTDGKYLRAYELFLTLGNYKDAPDRAAQCLLKNAQELSGRENVVMGYSSKMPWFSFDEDGGLRFDKEKYKGGTELVIPDVFDDVLVTRIASKAFFYSDFTSISIPAAVSFIGERAFFSCASLEEIVISDNVETLGESAFAGCTAAKTLTIGKGLTAIGQRAFKGCSSLTSVVIPEGVTEIGSRAFNGCTALAELSLPATLTTVGGFAFTECSALVTVRFSGTRADLEFAFLADDAGVILDCPGLVCAG